MAPTKSKHKNNKFDSVKSFARAQITIPLIGIESPTGTDHKGEYNKKINCHTNFQDVMTSSYEIPMVFFRDGTPDV